MDREGGGDLFGSSYPGAEGPCKGVTSRQGKDCSTRRPFLSSHMHDFVRILFKTKLPRLSSVPDLKSSGQERR